jgi:hypothetical protein
MVTMFDAATQGLDVVALGGVVRVRDGEDTWLCTQDGWQQVAEQLEARDQDAGDIGGGEAYSLLCRKVRSVSAIASTNGSPRGHSQPLVEAAYAAGLIDRDDASAMGALA